MSLYRTAFKPNMCSNFFSSSVKPTSNTVAWDTPSSSSQTIKLNLQYAKSSTAAPEFHFDELITGSENKPVYNKVARKHVISAMEGYNSVVFAYGQTASGKTFTLVSSVLALFPWRPRAALTFPLFLDGRRGPAGYYPSSHERRLCLHQTYDPRIPPPVLIHRNLQRNYNQIGRAHV